MVMNQTNAGQQFDPQEEVDRESANPLDEPLLSIDWVKATLDTKRTEFEAFFKNCKEAEDFYCFL